MAQYIVYLCSKMYIVDLTAWELFVFGEGARGGGGVEGSKQIDSKHLKQINLKKMTYL